MYHVIAEAPSGLHVMIAVKMCGLPNIFEPPKNMTLEVGQTAKFYCTVDMTCMVSYVEWYKQSDNGQSSWNLVIPD